MPRSRLRLLRARLHTSRLDAMLITFSPSVRYATTGFTGSNGLALLTPTRAVLLSDFRYKEQAAAQAGPGWRVHIPQGTALLAAARDRGYLRGARRVGFEAEHVSVAGLAEMRRTLRGVRLVPTTMFVETCATAKEDWEVANIRRAADISAAVFHEVLPMIKPGVRERDLAAELTYRHLQHGAEKDAFDAIVASGPRSSMPHGRASDRKIRRNEFVTIDFGCVVDGYHCDITRTVAVGKVSAEERRVYGIVFDAQQRALDAARAGMNARALDGVARDVITRAGYGPLFGHSLGHGLGLQVHEFPRVAQSSGKVTLEADTVITIEPGIYLPGRFGVRIEDDVRLTRTGCTLLTTRIVRELITL